MFFAVSGIDPTPLADATIAPHAGRGLRRQRSARCRFARDAVTLRMPTLTGCCRRNACCPNTAEVKKGAGHE